MKEIEIEKTDDGSITLYLPEMDEHYHSTNGAITESLHVFIEAGLKKTVAQGTISILEIGLGTGLNALLTALWANDNNRIVDYWGYELYPLAEDIISQLNYTDRVAHTDADSVFRKIHNSAWNNSIALSENFTLHKEHADVLKAKFQTQFDVIYFDAFAPNKQEEMWDQSLFDQISAHMKPNAVFTTYCAKGTVKRMLIAAGLEVQKVPGPPGKREMLTAYKR